METFKIQKIQKYRCEVIDNYEIDANSLSEALELLKNSDTDFEYFIDGDVNIIFENPIGKPEYISKL